MAGSELEVFFLVLCYSGLGYLRYLCLEEGVFM